MRDLEPRIHRIAASTLERRGRGRTRTPSGIQPDRPREHTGRVRRALDHLTIRFARTISNRTFSKFAPDEPGHVRRRRPARLRSSSSIGSSPSGRRSKKSWRTQLSISAGPFEIFAIDVPRFAASTSWQLNYARAAAGAGEAAKQSPQLSRSAPREARLPHRVRPFEDTTSVEDVPASTDRPPLPAPASASCWSAYSGAPLRLVHRVPREDEHRERERESGVAIQEWQTSIGAGEAKWAGRNASAPRRKSGDGVVAGRDGRGGSGVRRRAPSRLPRSTP